MAETVEDRGGRGSERSELADRTGSLRVCRDRVVQDRSEWRDSQMRLTVNDVVHDVEAPPEMPLLWVLRDLLGMTGTKYGCGIAQCGACTVHIDGRQQRSCVTPVSAAEGKRITTIEGLSQDASHPVQRAWAELDVVQCGYCQSGQIMAAAALLDETPDPDDDAIDIAMNGLICRCGTYPRIRAAVHRAVELNGRPGQ
jgi:isoquinoline 1-oxidoreductase alpha subunit